MFGKRIKMPYLVTCLANLKNDIPFRMLGQLIKMPHLVTCFGNLYNQRPIESIIKEPTLKNEKWKN